MELRDTIEMMQSDDYKERFKAEYYQTVIRYKKLNKLFVNWGNLDFKPVCPKNILMEQLRVMYDYLMVLQERAKIEGIELTDEIFGGTYAVNN